MIFQLTFDKIIYLFWLNNHYQIKGFQEVVPDFGPFLDFETTSTFSIQVFINFYFIGMNPDPYVNIL